MNHSNPLNYDDSIIIYPFLGVKPIGNNPINRDVEQILLKLEDERMMYINLYMENAKSRLALLRQKPNKIRDSVKTTHDEDIELDLFLHFNNEEKEHISRMYNIMITTASENNYEYVFDQYKYDTSYNKQYWVPKHHLENDTLNNDKIKLLYTFWDTIMDHLSINMKGKKNQYMFKTFEYLKSEMNKQKVIDINKCTNSYKLLDLNRHSRNELSNIQYEMEELTLNFSEDSVHQQFKHLINQIRSKKKDDKDNPNKDSIVEYDETTAKLMLLDKLKNEDDIKIVKHLGPLTLEAIAVWVLSKHFNPFKLEDSRVNTQTLVLDFDQTVRDHVALELNPEYIMAKKKGKKYISKHINKFKTKEEKEAAKANKEKIPRKDRNYAIGSLLYDYLYQKGILTKSNVAPVIKKVKGKVLYRNPSVYVTCNFQMEDIPISVPLPMVVPPLPWGLNNDKDSSYKQYIEPMLWEEYKSHIEKNAATHKRPEWDTLQFQSLNNMTGGYLTGASKFGKMKRDRQLISSHKDREYFDIHYNEHLSDQLLNNLNRLQEQAFSINVNFLKFLKKEWDTLRKYGLVMSRSLAYVNIVEATNTIRKFFKDARFENLKKSFKVDELITILHKNIQRATFEQATLKLAESLVGYRFYLPVYLDFRGRNYRRGVFHFHERDFMRSLFLFADPYNDDDDISEEGLELKWNQNMWVSNDEISCIRASTAFHQKKFSSYNEADVWFKQNVIHDSKMGSDSIRQFDDDRVLLELARRAKNPFQFLAGCQAILNLDKYTMKHIPITQDASASAYQMLSYFFLDPLMAKNTNLIRTFCEETGIPVIMDIYESMHKELISFASSKPSLSEDTHVSDYDYLIEQLSMTFDRKIIKSIYMPIIYGKTQNSTLRELSAKMSHKWDAELISNIVKVCFTFWDVKYKSVNNLMKLIQKISWITTKLGFNVIYGNNFYKTIQNYCKSVDETLTVYYDKSRKKKSTVIVKELTSTKDPAKTLTSTFANFIHQRDGLMIHYVLAMLRQKEQIDGIHIPIYTIHDNFLTTVKHAAILPHYYRRALFGFGHPLIIINKFLYDNLFARAITLGMTSDLCSNTTDGVYFNITRKIYDDEYVHSQTFGVEDADTINLYEIVKQYDAYRMYACALNLPLNSDTYLYWMNDTLDKNPEQIFMYILPDTLIQSCVDYCIKNRNMEQNKNEFSKNIKVVIENYKLYATSVYLGTPNMNEYYEHVFSNNLKPGRYGTDYCIHH